MGYALYVAQRDGKHQDAKVLSGFGGAGVLEVIKDYRGDTFRAVYTLKYAGKVFVLHAFQKKSKSGRQTPRRDIEPIKQGCARPKKWQKGKTYEQQKGIRNRKRQRV